MNQSISSHRHIVKRKKRESMAVAPPTGKSAWFDTCDPDIEMTYNDVPVQALRYLQRNSADCLLFLCRYWFRSPVGSGDSPGFLLKDKLGHTIACWEGYPHPIVIREGPTGAILLYHLPANAVSPAHVSQKKKTKKNRAEDIHVCLLRSVCVRMQQQKPALEALARHHHGQRHSSGSRFLIGASARHWISLGHVAWFFPS